MNILIGITDKDSLNDIEQLYDSGAREFFCGIMPKEWVNKYGYQVSLNRREFSECHFGTFHQLRKATEKIHSLNCKIFVTLNAHYYIPEQYKYIEKYLQRLQQIGIDWLIIADLSLLLFINKNSNFDFKIALSGEAGIYNLESINFYNKLGISRIMFPRHLTIDEISNLVKKSKNLGIEYEVFIMAERCPYSADVCFASHGWASQRFCYLPVNEYLYECVKFIGDNSSKNKEGSDITWNDFCKWENNNFKYRIWKESNLYPHYNINLVHCGLCKISNFKRFGIDSLKIVSRGVSLENRINMLKLVNKVLKESNPTKEFCKKLMSNSKMCNLGYLCYYR